MENTSAFITYAAHAINTVLPYLRDGHLLAQIVLGSLSFILAWLLGQRLWQRLEAFLPMEHFLLRQLRLRLLDLLYPLLALLFTGVSQVALEVGFGTAPLLVQVNILLLAWILIRLVASTVNNREMGMLLSMVIFGFAALSMTGTLEPTINVLNKMQLSLGTFHLSLAKLIEVSITIVLLVWGATLLSSLFETYLKSVTHLTPASRVLIGKVTRIGLVTLALLMAIGASGIDFTALAVFSGAIGVGIGFGLQKVVSNFISGLIILMDKSVKPGDNIMLDGTYGWITNLSARFVSVATRDGVEYLIPNEDFITQRLVNMSFSDRNVRLKIPFGVSYHSDPQKAIELALEAAEESPRVLKNPAPVCWLLNFGASSLELELRVWINDPQMGSGNVRGDLMLRLWNKFKANGIEIPFPQMDVHVKDLPPKLDF